MGIFDNFIYKDGEIIDNSWVKWFIGVFQMRKEKNESDNANN